MPSLQVRDLPENIYLLLREKARKDHRSLAQEAVVALAKGLQTSTSNKIRRKQLLRAIVDDPCVSESALHLDPIQLIREDRER